MCASAVARQSPSWSNMPRPSLPWPSATFAPVSSMRMWWSPGLSRLPMESPAFWRTMSGKSATPGRATRPLRRSEKPSSNHEERMKVRSIGGALLLLCLVSLLSAAQSSAQEKEIQLPSSKALRLPAPGASQPTNSFPTAVALSPDGKYLAILNNGYGAAESKFQQSIALLDLASNQLRDFPDPHLGLHAKQSYFLGLAWSSDGTSLYASMAIADRPRRHEARRYWQRSRRVSLAERHAGGGPFSEAAARPARSRKTIYLQSQERCAVAMPIRIRPDWLW